MISQTQDQTGKNKENWRGWRILGCVTGEALVFLISEE
jgi:hypothetical protein